MDRHPLKTRQQGDESGRARDEVADQNGLAAVPLEHLARLVQIRLFHEQEPAETTDEPAQVLLAKPESRQVHHQGGDSCPHSRGHQHRDEGETFLPDQAPSEGHNQLRRRQQVQVPQRRQSTHPDVAERIEDVDNP